MLGSAQRGNIETPGLFSVEDAASDSDSWYRAMMRKMHCSSAR
jgi:hypothetical protein